MTISLPLGDEKLRELFASYEQGERAEWTHWRERALAWLRRVQERSDEELLMPRMQRELWTNRSIAPLGMGEAVSTDILNDNREIAEALIGLRRREWPRATEERGRALQQAYDQLLARIQPLCGRRPVAKLQRYFAALLPGELHCSFSWQSQKRITELILGRGAFGSIYDAVCVRARLREVGLRGATDYRSELERDVDHAQFTRFLYDHYERIKRGEEVKFEGAKPAPVDEEISGKPLVLWPYASQRKGLGAVRGYAHTLRALVQCCQGGATLDDIVPLMHSEHGLADYQRKSIRGIASLAKALDLIVQRGELLFPTEAGEEVLATDPPDILVERIIERVFGTAQLLRAFAERGALSRHDMDEVLRQSHPAWQTGMTVSSLRLWIQSLDLIEYDAEGHVWSLTDYGRAWAERLPASLPGPTVIHASAANLFNDEEDNEPSAPALGVLPDTIGAAPEPWQPPRLDTLWQAFQADPALARFVFMREQVRDLHLAWHLIPSNEGAASGRPAKRFVILSGLSGTGKTALLTHYARIYCGLVGIPPDRHVATVAVSPDWRDPSGLLGYVNALQEDPAFVREPTLNLLLSAHSRPHEPHFLILDEMNLAHPEHYFAPFLSAMETGGALDLHAYDADQIADVPERIRWPRNLFIGGTVNMDETTHPFSDKVLDRAFVVEFWQVDLDGYFARRRLDDVAAFGEGGSADELDAMYTFFAGLNRVLFKARRHVGYRSIGEALDFVCAGAREGLHGSELWSLFDHAVFAKVLPRLRGHDTTDLRDALDGAKTLCATRGMERCVAKLDEMRVRLEQTGITRFFG